MKWKNFFKFNDDDFDPLEQIRDSKKEFSYEELFEISKPLNDDDYMKYSKWNKFSISNFNNIEQIFYDIANSKKARNIYRRVNFVLTIICIFKILMFSGILFSCCGLFISLNKFFLMPISYWINLTIGNILQIFLNTLIIFIFEEYIDIYDYKLGEIDFKYSSNKIYERTEYKYGTAFFNWGQKGKIQSLYRTYQAIDGKKYLVKEGKSGKYFSMRNWYLVSKYIALKKISLDKLPPHYRDELFIFLSTANFKKDKIKLKCIFNVEFSLNFFPRFYLVLDSLIFFLSFVIFLMGLIFWYFII